MRLFSLALASIALISLPFLSYGAQEIDPPFYVELGLGITQHQAVDSSSSESELPQSLAGKVLIGGKIFNSSRIWYELMYNYDSTTKYSDTNFEFSSQSVSTGLKLTTNSNNKFVAFTRFGGGITRFDTRNNGSFSSASKNQAYAGIGIGHRLTNRQFLNLEYQIFHYFDLGAGAIDENSGSLFFTYQNYLD